MMIRKLLILFFCSMSLSAWADNEFLTPEQAFGFNAQVQLNSVQLQWRIADGYYLYKDQLKLRLDGQPFTLPDDLAWQQKDDPYFGKVWIMKHNMDIKVGRVKTSELLEISYQGCAEAGLCYAPIKKKIDLTGSATVVEPGFAVEISEEQTYTEYLNNSHWLLTLGAFFIFGVVTSFAGCSYPMFPILSKIIIGQAEGINSRKSFLLSVAYVLPIALVYSGLGLIGGLFGSSMASWMQTPTVITSTALLLIAMALSMMGFYQLQMPEFIRAKLTNAGGRLHGGSYIAASSMGLLSAFIVSACVVPPVVAAMAFIAQRGDLLLGMMAMFVFGLGLGFPLLVLGASAGWLLPRAGHWMESLQKIMGVFLLLAAAWILERIVTPMFASLLWFTLSGCLAVYFINSMSKTFKYIGYASAMLAFVLASQLIYSLFSSRQSALSFQYVSSPTQLSLVISQSPKQQPIFLDYYADWCVSCRKIEQEVFTETSIRQQLLQFTRIKIDLSDMTSEKQALMNSHGVYGPPALLMLNSAGVEARVLRVVGEVDVSKLTRILNGALAR